MSNFKVRPIVGQEAITSYGLGRVLSFLDNFPDQYVEVQPYFCERKGKVSEGWPMKFSPSNVTLVMPGSGNLVKVMEEHSSDKQNPANSEPNTLRALALAVAATAETHANSWITPVDDRGYGEYKISLSDAANQHGELAILVNMLLYHSWEDALAWANNILKGTEVAS